MQHPGSAVTSGSGRSPRWALRTVGVVVIVIGLGLLIWPFVAASWILVLLFGSALIANGLALIVRSRSSAASVLGGVLLILAGLFPLLVPQFVASAFVTFIGIGVVAVGIIWIAIGARFGGGAAIAPGVLLLLTGVVALVWPDVALAIVAVIGGIGMILLGTTLILAANRMRSSGPDQTTIVI